MSGTAYRTFGVLAIAAIFLGIWYFFSAATTTSITEDLSLYNDLGDRIEADFNQYPLLTFSDDYTLTDTLKDGIEITYGGVRAAEDTLQEEGMTWAGAPERPLSEEVSEADTSFTSPGLRETLSLQFPKTLAEPIAVTLSGGRTIFVQQEDNTDASVSLLTNSPAEVPQEEGMTWASAPERPLSEEASAGEQSAQYLKYTTPDARINTYYAYQKDQANGYRNLKHWTIFTDGDGEESQSYRFSNAHLRLTDSGSVEVRYLASPDESMKAQVGDDLWARAQAVLAEDLAANIEHTEPDLIIPAPYTIDTNGEQTTHDWVVTPADAINPADASGDFILSTEFEVPLLSYPIALDPTLQFTAPGYTEAGSVITGENANDYFGYSMTVGDFDNDGTDDLAVGARSCSGNAGCVFVFFGGSVMHVEAAKADVTLVGETAPSFFGWSLTTGDFNADGKDDLAVGAYFYNSQQGRAYIFYNDNIVSQDASGADVTITGEYGNFGAALTTGDFNADGKDDLAVGAPNYSGGSYSFGGRAYVFYGDGSIPTTAAGADVVISGNSTFNVIGFSLTTGDFNADGKDDLVVGAPNYSTQTGRAYVFYGGSMVSETSAGADVTLTGETTNNYFGSSLTTGDFNADGKDDLVVGAYGYASNTGRTYLFYGGSMVSENASGADIILTGETTSNSFGAVLTTGDFNADGKDDLAVGATAYTTNTGRAYIFYGGGMVSENASGADATLTGEAANNQLGTSLTTGDFNADGKDDLAVGAYGYNSNQGRAYIFYSQSGQVNLNKHITGEATGNNFGSSFTTGDFNADGREDLVVGAPKYSSNTGRAYIFYGYTSTTTASGADVVLTGEATSNSFGTSLTTGDFNADGKDDLAVGANGYDVDASTNDGRVYVFYGGSMTSENASGADVLITGEAASDSFGASLTTGDFNADGKDDLAVGAAAAASIAGKVYVLYNASITTGSASIADVEYTGITALDFLGSALTTGDFNADGVDDLLAAADYVGSAKGAVYLMYGGAMSSSSVSAADVTFSNTGVGGRFGSVIAAADLNNDNIDDVIIGAEEYAYGTVFIFYGGSLMDAVMTDADVTLSDDVTSRLGQSLTTGDFNADGKDDLAVGGHYYSTNTGRTYLFYGPDITSGVASATAGIIITGSATNDDFGTALITYDYNHDGREDLVVGAPGYSAGGDTGRIYFYETRENYVWDLQKQSLVDGVRAHPVMGHEMKVTGESGSGQFGTSITVGDFNADGKLDLAVGAPNFNSSTGRVYIFYNDSNYETKASRADVTLTGEATNNNFGTTLTTGDFNADGKLDLAVGAPYYSTFTGRTYIFYGNNFSSKKASLADIILTGESTAFFGEALTTGDFNADGKDDLAVGSTWYNLNAGRSYIFYGGSMISENAANADVVLTGSQPSIEFGSSLVSGDFNADGKDDLAVGAESYDVGSNTSEGRVYIFYGGSMISETSAGADVTLTGQATNNFFGTSLTTGDFNADGKDDLAVGAYYYSSLTGRTYIFYGGSMVSENATGADVILTGEASSALGYFLTTGDFNADGKDDLAVGAYNYSSGTGRTYIFYGGSIITENATGADVILTGETTSDHFGTALTTGDFNADGKDDLAVGAYGNSSSRGRMYFYTTNDFQITGVGSGENAGGALATGDFNADGKLDLAVGASGYSTNTGRVYIFYGGKLKTETISGADVILTGETTSDYFGTTLTTGDFNADGKDDLVVGAYGYTSGTGRVYIFYGGSMISENATGADIILTGEAGINHFFGAALTTGDFNADGKDDLAVGAYGYTTYIGRAYIFYGGSMVSENASGADVTLTGEATGNYFGYALTTGDFNADGKDDLAVGAATYSSGAGRAYIFYGGSMVSENATGADVVLTGETTNNYFGSALTTGDFNADGRDDLAVGAYGYSTNTGRSYIFYGGSMISENASGADVTLTGEATVTSFGSALTTGDFNADGRDDLAVGAWGYNSTQGRIHLFNSGFGSRPATEADLIITGEKTSSNFSRSLYAADVNGDGTDDLVVGSSGYDVSSNEGRVYVIVSEIAAVRYSQHKMQGTMKIQGSGTFH